MKTLILDASGQMRFSWESEHAISHFLQPLHRERSLAIQTSFFFVLAKQRFLESVCWDISIFQVLLSMLQRNQRSCCPKNEEPPSLVRL
jgi:hypothetical protein